MLNRLICGLSVFLFVACGGASAETPTTPSANAESGTPSWSERAVNAYLNGDFDAARRASQNALQLDAHDDHAMEVAARVALGELNADGALRALENAHGPTLLRLRARANALLGKYADVARDLAAVEGQEPSDGWSVAMLPVARSASSAPHFTFTGETRAELAYAGEVPIPLVEITINGARTHALVATSASTTVIDDDGHPTGLMLEDIALGGVHVHNVPAFARDLAEIENAVHLPVRAVIGTDLLMRLHATLDGQHRKLIVSTTAMPIPQDALPLPLTMFQGSLLAVRASLNDGAPQFYAVDSAAGLVLALADVAVQSMHIDPTTLPAVPGAPVPNARVVDIETFHLGEAAIEHVPGVTGLVPPHLVEVAGTRIYGVIGSQFLGQFQMSFDTEQRAIALRVDAADASDEDGKR